MIERQPFGRFLDLHDNGVVGEMAARRVPDIFEERAAQQQDEIGIPEGLANLGGIARKRLAIVRMAGRKRRMRPQAFEPDRRADRLSQRDELLMRSGARDIVADHDRGPRRLQEKCCDLREPLGIRLRGTPQFIRPAGLDRGFLLHHVDRERNEDRPAGRIGRDLERAAQDGRHLVRPLHLHAPLGDRCGHGDEIMTEQRIGKPHPRILLSRGDDEGRTGLQRAVERAHRIAQPRRDVNVGKSRAAGGLRVETRRSNRNALMQRHDVVDLRIGSQAIQQRGLCGSGIAEDMAYAVRDQGFHQHTPSAHFLLRLQANV